MSNSSHGSGVFWKPMSYLTSSSEAGSSNYGSHRNNFQSGRRGNADVQREDGRSNGSEAESIDERSFFKPGRERDRVSHFIFGDSSASGSSQGAPRIQSHAARIRKRDQDRSQRNLPGNFLQPSQDGQKPETGMAVPSQTYVQPITGLAAGPLPNGFLQGSGTEAGCFFAIQQESQGVLAIGQAPCVHGAQMQGQPVQQILPQQQQQLQPLANPNSASWAPVQVQVLQPMLPFVGQSQMPTEQQVQQVQQPQMQIQQQQQHPIQQQDQPQQLVNPAQTQPSQAQQPLQQLQQQQQLLLLLQQQQEQLPLQGQLQVQQQQLLQQMQQQMQLQIQQPQLQMPQPEQSTAAEDGGQRFDSSPKSQLASEGDEDQAAERLASREAKASKAKSSSLPSAPARPGSKQPTAAPRDANMRLAQPLPVGPQDPSETKGSTVEELLAKVPHNEEGERTSLGSLQHPDTCSPCLFWFKGKCGKGVHCDYCHFRHPGQKNKRIRPSKHTRLQMRAAQKDDEEEDD